MAEIIEHEPIAVIDLVLDPNNPRFADLGVSREVPRERVHEASVQQTALDRMLDDRFGVPELKESIKKLGFLPVDRLIAVELPVLGKYMVIEGNRRLAAVKSLLDDLDQGIEEITPATLATFEALPVVVLLGTPDETMHFARVLQGTRHVGGVRQWGPYQQAQLIGQMLADGMTGPDIRRLLGLTQQRVTSLRRVYLAMEQMRGDSEFGSFVKPELFSNFEEALKVPRIRTWLQWSDETGRIEDSEARENFYAWISGTEDDGQRFNKIIDAKDFRLLPRVMDDPVQWERFKADPRLTLQEAGTSLVPDLPSFDWRAALRRDLGHLQQIPALALADATDADVDLLQELRASCDQLLHNIDALNLEQVSQT